MKFLQLSLQSCRALKRAGISHPFHQNPIDPHCSIFSLQLFENIVLILQRIGAKSQSTLPNHATQLAVYFAHLISKLHDDKQEKTFQQDHNKEGLMIMNAPLVKRINKAM